MPFKTESTQQTPLQYQIKFYKTANIYQREQEKRKRK